MYDADVMLDVIWQMWFPEKSFRYYKISLITLVYLIKWYVVNINIVKKKK